METCLYTAEEHSAVRQHIETAFGPARLLVLDESLEPTDVDILAIEPTPERPYYTLTTMGMGAFSMDLPAELEDYQMDRAELYLWLPPDWKVESPREADRWPVYLLKGLAKAVRNQEFWLGWGHTVEDDEPYARDTELCGCLMTGSSALDGTTDVCLLPSGQQVHFYQVVPLYQEELEFKQAHGAEALLDLLHGDGFLIQPDRPNVCEGFDPWLFSVMLDDAGWHLDSIREKNLFVEDLAVYNHIAIYLRWAYETGLLSGEFCEAFPQLAGEMEAQPVDLRLFVRDQLHGVLLRTFFNHAGMEFANYYYSYDDPDDDHFYAADVDDYAYHYFGHDRYHSQEFQDEAYLFVPFDEAYYQAMKKRIDSHYEEYQQSWTENPSSSKDFYLKREEIRPVLTDWDGPEGCLATDRIMVDGSRVGYCYREEPADFFAGWDSGWRFLAGDETDAYMHHAANSGIFALNTVCNYDPEIVPLLTAPYGTAFARDENGIFQQLTDAVIQADKLS